MSGVIILTLIVLMVPSEKIIGSIARWMSRHRRAHRALVDEVNQVHAEVQFLDLTDTWEHLEPEVQREIRRHHTDLLSALRRCDKTRAAAASGRLLTLLNSTRPRDVVGRAA